MATLKFRRRNASRRRAADPQRPEPRGLSVPVLRVNRFVAVVTVLGALGSVALAVALTPGSQTGASRADAAQASLAISDIKGPAPAIVEAAPAAAPVIAAPPQRAAKSDRLAAIAWSPEPEPLDPSPETELLRGSLDDVEVTEPSPASTAATPEAGPRPTGSLEVELEVEEAIRSTLSQSPAAEDVASAYAGTEPSLDNIETGSIEPAAEAVEDANIEPTAEAAIETTDEGVEDTVEDTGEQTLALAGTTAATDTGAEPAPKPVVKPEPKPEAAAPSRTASVRTDVNLRSKPVNGSKSILVVPAGRQVEVIACDYWCEVIYAGKRGFIYKGFLPSAKKGSAPAAKKAPEPTTTVASSAPEPVRVKPDRKQDR